MHGTRRAAAALAVLAMVFQGLLPALAAESATVKGTVQIPCDPSMVAEVISIYVKPESGGSVTMIPVDPSTGEFLGTELVEGTYELLPLGADGQPLVPEPKQLVLAAGDNEIVVSIEPPGCGEQAADPAGEQDTKLPKTKKGLKDWQLSLIYVGVVIAIVLAVDTNADDEPVSPSVP